MVIVAFLQCQWFNPTSVWAVRRTYAKHAITPKDRADLNARYLFLRSATGRNLRAAFGQDLCGEIVWEETTKELGDHPSFNPKPDYEHMQSVLAHFKPDVVITFGANAKAALSAIGTGLAVIINSPHPVARHATARIELVNAANELKKLITTNTAQPAAIGE